MWLIFGFLTIIATIINIFLYISQKNYTFMMTTAIIFTAITLCAEQSLISNWIQQKDYSALSEVPRMNIFFWLFTIFSIVLNIIPFILDYKKNRYKVNI